MTDNCKNVSSTRNFEKKISQQKLLKKLDFQKNCSTKNIKNICWTRHFGKNCFTRNFGKFARQEILSFKDKKKVRWRFEIKKLETVKIKHVEDINQMVQKKSRRRKKKGGKRDKESNSEQVSHRRREELPTANCGGGFRSRNHPTCLRLPKVHLSESRIRAKPRDIFSITRLTVVIYLSKRRSRALRLTDEE